MAPSPTEAPTDQAPADTAPLGEKHELATRPADLVQRIPLSRALGPYVLSDDEIRRTYRLASALAASGMYKDAGGKVTPEQAFAKILIGQDLRISATRALAGLDIVKGNVQMRGVLLLAFVRESRTYDYRIIELDGETELPGKTPAEIEAEQRATLRFFEVAPDGTKEALHPDITFTMAMARKQGNVKPDSAWMSARRNMLLWRAASDGVKFHCPDLLGGIPVYTEADSFAEPAGLGDGTGDGNAVGLHLGPDVEAVIDRATELGHAGLADRATIEMLLGDQPPAKVAEWVKAAGRELDEIPVDAEIVPEAAEGAVPSNAAQAAEPLRDPADASEAPAAAPEPGESPLPEPAVTDPERIAALRRRGLELLTDAEALRDAGDPRADEVFEEFERVSAEVDAAGNVDQGSLPL